MNDQVTARTAGLAVWSLVLAIAGFILLGPLGTIPAIICGHLAIPKINRSAGALTGRGLAIAGLVIGYLGIVLQLLILPALLLPAIASARQKAQRVQCMNNLGQIGKGCMLYSMDNNEQYPPDFKTLAKTSTMSPKVFVCPATGHQPGQMTEVDTWTDYVLVATRKAGEPGDAVLAFSKPECYKGKGGNILFNDGSVQWCNTEEYNRLTSGLKR